MNIRFSQAQLTVAITALVFALLFLSASASLDRFFRLPVFLNFFTNNAALGILAIGMTFVILSGGIDLSVGSMVGFTTVVIAALTSSLGLHPLAAIALALVVGLVFGAAMGCLIHFFQLAPFLVTLAGMFLAKGLAFVIRSEAVPLSHPFFREMSGFMWTLAPGAFLRAHSLLFLALIPPAILLASYTRFGRNVYAVGGNETSAQLMGLPIAATRIAVYALSGFCSALAGVATVFAMPSGNASLGEGKELEAIAAVVIGGTLLSGGVGHVAGTVIGVLILATIRSAIDSHGGLSTWWINIVIGAMLFIFVVAQRFLAARLKTAQIGALPLALPSPAGLRGGGQE